jgi:TolB-like protein
MAKKIGVLVAVLLFGLRVLPAGSQEVSPEGPESLADLDGITETLASRLYIRLRGLARGNENFSIALGRFTIGGEDSTLGDLYRSNLMGVLANLETRPFLIIDRNASPSPVPDGTPAESAAPPAVDYLISGDIFDVNNALRITVRIVRQSDSSIIAVWNSDFGRSIWLAGLLEQTARNSGDGSRRDRYETDSQERPVPVEIGGPWISRTIHDTDDRDWFLVTSPARAMLSAETSGSMDTMMELYDDSGARIASDDDGGEGTNSRISFSAEADRRYIIMVRGYGSHTGAYRFHVATETVPDEAVEPNNSREQATPLALGAAGGFRAYLYSDDEDWYLAEVPEGGAQVVIYTESSLDTFLTIYNADGTRIAEDDDSGQGNNARVMVNLPAGPFYIKASLYSGSSSRGPYTLFTGIREPVAQDAYEPDNQLSQAKDIEVGQSQTRNFSDAGDVDWVRLRITRAGRYGIRARGENSGNLDTYLELLDASEVVIAEDDDGGRDLDAYLSQELQPGTYYIKVTTLERDPQGNYILSVAAEQQEEKR